MAGDVLAFIQALRGQAGNGLSPHVSAALAGAAPEARGGAAPSDAEATGRVVSDGEADAAGAAVCARDAPEDAVDDGAAGAPADGEAGAVSSAAAAGAAGEGGGSSFEHAELAATRPTSPASPARKRAFVMRRPTIATIGRVRWGWIAFRASELDRSAFLRVDSRAIGGFST
jgi:hypothetical protein